LLELQIVLDYLTGIMYNIGMINETVVIKEIENKEAGIKVVVAQISSGFSVIVRDTEADESFGIALIYKTAETAITKAEEIAVKS
jgi:predicted RNA-binding protein with TRAM domain